jgi:hypothetical protein
MPPVQLPRSGCRASQHGPVKVNDSTALASLGLRSFPALRGWSACVAGARQVPVFAVAGGLRLAPVHGPGWLALRVLRPQLASELGGAGPECRGVGSCLLGILAEASDDVAPGSALGLGDGRGRRGGEATAPPPRDGRAPCQR